ncbi:unnamed protein product [Adineta steineri]|uniref:Uncharacterized protein n=1 Tax=Adineta steineri TaxID=433720 RepID=A0A814K7D2_9BILA|nr:unnamed protein product [Adineta steineri]CAF3804862.1 unnamed protein product [Adineta steineri]
MSETKVKAEFTSDQLYNHAPSGKDYNINYNDLMNRVNEVLPSMKSLEGESQLSNLIKKSLQYVSKWNNTFVVDQERKDLLLSIGFTAVGTGLMINSLSTTFDIIKECEKFRESPILQQKTAEIKGHRDTAEKHYKAANNQMDEIDMTSDGSAKENALQKIAINLERAELECERAQEILKNILGDIHQTMEKLSSRKKIHLDGFHTTVLRFISTVIELLAKPSSSWTHITKLFSFTNIGLQTVNTVAHGVGYYLTNNEIQKLQEHQHKLDILAMEMKYLFGDIKYGMEKLEKIKKYMDFV